MDVNPQIHLEKIRTYNASNITANRKNVQSRKFENRNRKMVTTIAKITASQKNAGGMT